MEVSFLEKISVTLRSFLKQGITPKKLALGLALGTVIGVIPLFFVATPLCILLAYILGLNQIIIQVANHSVGYPLQVALFYPFIVVGSSFIFKNYLLKYEAVSSLFRGGLSKFTHELVIFISQALLGWVILAPFLFFVLFWIFYLILKQIKINS